MNRAKIIITDSGGRRQPRRDTTERPEAIDGGTVLQAPMKT